MLFNSQAFISTIILTGLLISIYIGSMFVFYYRWNFGRLIGAFVAILSMAAFVSHVTALIQGA